MAHHRFTMRQLPSGTVTFLFTDIEGSTRLVQELGSEAYAAALADHRRALEEIFSTHGGSVVDTQGDAFFVAFPTAPDALAAAARAQEAFGARNIRMRMGIHTGTPLVTGDGYIGVDVHRAARIAAAGSGGQVLVSASTAALLEDTELKDLGEHRLKDLARPERLFQLGNVEFPPIRSLYRTNLPVPPTPFVGRTGDIEAVSALLGRDDVGLLTLTGSGGTGKTRLALQAAAEVADLFPDGVWWLPLAPLRDPALVLPAIEDLLGAGGESGLDIHDAIAAATSGMQMLFVLDNAEHLLPSVTESITFLRDIAGPTVMVTSRERLRLQGEHSYPVGPLSPPDAIQLFDARARAIEAAFEPTASVAELCSRLDFLPLALELAAARLPLFSPDELLERLGSQLDLLTGGRDADPRQRTMRATVQWSYNLLNADEQRVFAQLSIFAGGFTLAAVERVAGADLAQIESLLDKSLLRRSGDRFWMMEVIREFAAEELERSGKLGELGRRFFDYYLGLAESEPFGSWQRSWFDQLQSEHENLLYAQQTAPSAELALRLSVSLGDFWIWEGHLREGRNSIESLFSKAHDADDDIRARGALVGAGLATLQDDYARAAELLDTADRLFSAIDDPSGRALVLLARGWQQVLRGGTNEAVALLEEGLRLIRSSASDHLLVRALRMLAMAEERRGNYDRVLELQTESLKRSRDSGDDAGAILIISDLAWSAVRRGEYEEAVLLAQESLELGGEKEIGRFDTATQHTLALALLGLGKRDEAHDLGIRALHTAADQHDVAGCSALLDLLAAIAAAAGEEPKAARLTGAADGLLARIGADSWDLDVARPIYMDDLRRAREHLGESEWRAHAAAGAGMELEEAVALALSGRSSRR